MPNQVPAIKVLLLPKDTNALGTIFGGVILSHIDLASAVEARKTATHRYVTKAMNAVEFHAPVFVGDLVNFFTETTRVGRTSITVKVVVEAERWGAGQGERVKVTEAEVVLVADRARRRAGADSTRHDRRRTRPGSVSNVACGFDVLGFALDEPGDVVVAAPQDAVGRLDRRDSRRRRPAVDDPQKNTASAAVLALLQRLETTARRVADDPQRPAARERHRQQRRQRGRRRRRGQRAARPAGADGDAARMRDGGRAGGLRRRFIPTTSRRRYTAASSWRGARSRPTSSACRCLTGWRARFCIRTSRSRPARRDS